MTDTSIITHAGCALIGQSACLFLGPSGSGKSDLLLRLIDDGAMLISDDQVLLSRDAEHIIAQPPEKIAGLLEVRGLGVIRVKYTEQAPLTHVFKLVARDAIERMPDPHFYDCLGMQLPLHYIHAFDNSVIMKIRLMMNETPL